MICEPSTRCSQRSAISTVPRTISPPCASLASRLIRQSLLRLECLVPDQKRGGSFLTEQPLEREKGPRSACLPLDVRCWTPVVATNAAVPLINTIPRCLAPRTMRHEVPLRPIHVPARIQRHVNAAVSIKRHV